MPFVLVLWSRRKEKNAGSAEAKDIEDEVKTE
jgi:hypothetical protein